MKKYFILLGMLAVAGCTGSRPVQENRIQVGVFDGFGGAQTCIWETVSAIRLDPGMDVRTVTSAEIAAGVLDSLDAIVIPGGGGSRQYLNLGEANVQRIKQFVANGGGAVGICAGAYLFSDTPGYTCLSLNGAQAIDIEHDNRGHGISKFTLTEEGKALFPEVAGRDTLYVMYYEGPVFIPREGSEVAFDTFAVMESDVHEEGNAPAGMTCGKPFYIGNTYGKGRVFSSIAHPEATPGMMWMVPRMVRWTLDLPAVEYASGAVNPDRFNREILMTIDDLKYESGCLRPLMYGDAQEKLTRLEWLYDHHSWDAKRWIQGLVYDADPAVRLRAAQYIAGIQYLRYLDDVKAACATETDPEIRPGMESALLALQALLPE